MFRLAKCCVRIMWRLPSTHQQSGSYIPNPFQAATFQQLLQSQPNQQSGPITPNLLELRAQAEAYRVQQEQQQQVAQYLVQQQVLQQQQQGQSEQQQQQHQQQREQHQPQQEHRNQQVQPFPITQPPLVAHKFYHESSREFYNRFYSLSSSPSPDSKNPNNIRATESQEASQVYKDEHSPVTDQLKAQDNTAIDSDVDLVQVLDQENPPTIDLADSDMKRRPHKSTSKRSHNDSDKAREDVTSPPKHQKVAESEKKDMEIEDDPAVLVVGQSSQVVSQEAVQFLGGRVQELDVRQERHYSTHSTPDTTKAKVSPSKSPVHPLRDRKWTELSHSRPSDRHHVHFSVMSYNVLAQQLIEANGRLYETTPHNYLNWEYRSKNLLQEMMHYQPDVMCLQEVQRSHFEDFYKPRLKSFGYDGVYICRTGDKHDGCATFYKTSKFELEAHEGIKYFLPNVDLMDRDNVGLVVRLKTRRRSRKGTRLVVGNTHLLFNPRRGDIKLAQLQLLLAAIDRMAYDPKAHKQYHPIILCGDMNAKPHSALYRFLADGYLRYEGLLVRNIGGMVDQRGQNYYLQRQLLPRSVGITDGCQYADDVVARLEADCQSKSQPKKTDTAASATKLPQKSDGELSDDSETDGVASNSTDIKESEAYKKQMRFESGELTHNLQLRSVYEYLTHTKDNRPIPQADLEVSTHHGLACEAVDYIFCSCLSKKKKKKKKWHKSKDSEKKKDSEEEREEISDNRLKVLSRLNLPLNKDMDQIGFLPNAAVSSDHVLLLTKFALYMG